MDCLGEDCHFGLKFGRVIYSENVIVGIEIKAKGQASVLSSSHIQLKKPHSLAHAS